MHSRYLLLTILVGWINRDQQAVIDYLLETIATYQKQLGGRRLRLDKIFADGWPLKGNGWGVKG